MQTKNETRTRQVCEPKMEERCVNFTLPSFEKVTWFNFGKGKENTFWRFLRSQQLLLLHQVDVNMTENVELGSLKADIRENERTKCLNIPNAKVDDQFSKKQQIIIFSL